MSKKIVLIILTITLLLTIISYGYEFGPPYKIYLVNRSVRGGVVLITANIDVNLKKMNLEYFADEQILEIEIGEILNDSKNVNVLNTYNIECNPTAGRDKLKLIQLDIPKFVKGMELVVWVNKLEFDDIKLGEIQKNDLLEAIKNIKLEQDRLTVINSYKGKNGVLSEIDRNQDE